MDSLSASGWDRRVWRAIGRLEVVYDSVVAVTTNQLIAKLGNAYAVGIVCVCVCVPEDRDRRQNQD